MDDPRKKSLRLAIKEMVLALSRKVLKKRRFSVLCRFCTNVTVDVSMNKT